jgi:hypothetical protein
MRGALGRVGNGLVGRADASRSEGYQGLVAPLVGCTSLFHAGATYETTVWAARLLGLPPPVSGRFTIALRSLTPTGPMCVSLYKHLGRICHGVCRCHSKKEHQQHGMKTQHGCIVFRYTKSSHARARSLSGRGVPVYRCSKICSMPVERDWPFTQWATDWPLAMVQPAMAAFRLWVDLTFFWRETLSSTEPFAFTSMPFRPRPPRLWLAHCPSGAKWPPTLPIHWY